MNIEKILEERNLSIRKCALQSGIPYTTLLEIVNGKTDIRKSSALSVYKLAQALGLTMEELLGAENNAAIAEKERADAADIAAQWETLTAIPLTVVKDGCVAYRSNKYTQPVDENCIDKFRQMGSEPCRMNVIDDLFSVAGYVDRQNILYIAGPVALHRFQDRMYQQSVPKFPSFVIPMEKVRVLSIVEWHIHWNLLMGLVTGQMASTETVLRHLQPDSIWFADYELQKYQADMTELERPRNTYEEILPLLDAVRCGDIGAFLRHFDLSLYSRIGMLASSSWKQTEYLTVKVISLFMHAMIDGGVDYRIAYDASDLFLQRLEKCTEITQMIELQMEFVLYAINTVKKNQTNAASVDVVEAAKQYIARNHNKRITLKELAQTISINPSYLSRKFSIKENMTIQQYILREKVHAACNMLKFTDQDITSIASFLCFSSQSHFSSAFRKIMQQSPSEYRKRNGEIERK